MSGAHFLRSYADLDSPIHRAPAWMKLLATLALLALIALVPTARAAWTGLVLVVVAAVARAGRIPLGAFALRVALVQPFVLGIALLALFQPGGVPIFISLATKSTVAVASVQLLAHTTPFHEVLGVLRSARVPALLLLVLSLLHRYVFLVAEESLRMRRARRARMWTATKRGTWRAFSSVIAASFVRSVARAERIALAMRARGGP
jgi:cobalt/nickel transport system permease protein